MAHADDLTRHFPQVQRAAAAQTAEFRDLPAADTESGDRMRDEQNTEGLANEQVNAAPAPDQPEPSPLNPLKIVLSLKPTGETTYTAVIAAGTAACDPIFCTVEQAELPAIVRSIPGLVAEARTRWQTHSRYPSAQKPKAKPVPDRQTQAGQPQPVRRTGGGHPSSASEPGVPLPPAEPPAQPVPAPAPPAAEQPGTGQLSLFDMLNSVDDQKGA